MNKILLWALLIGLVLLGGGALLTWNVESTSICAACFSTAETREWRLGEDVESDLLLLRVRRTVHPSPLLREQMGSTCAHDFKPQSSFENKILGDGPTRGSAWTDLRRSRLMETYDKDPEFRRFILEKERIGDLQASDFVDAVLLDDTLRQAPWGRYRDLYELAEWLMGEYDESHPLP